MSIGKIFLFLLFALIVIVGISFAYSQSKGSLRLSINLKNPILRSILWQDPVVSTTTEKEITPPKEIEKEPAITTPPPKPLPTPPDGFSIAELSPSWKKVRIRNVTPPNSSNYSFLNGFTLRAESENTEKVSITGWRIRGNRKIDVYIPKAAPDYGISGLPTEETILLSPSDYVVFYSTQSPVGRNFRLNSCTGYLGNTNTFTPSLSRACPTPYVNSELVTLSGNCQNFIRSLGTCPLIKANDINRFSGSNDAACRAILDRFSYGVCYNAYHNDSRFFSHEWRVWLGNPMPFDPQHDRILLYDASGFLVDQYIY